MKNKEHNVIMPSLLMSKVNNENKTQLDVFKENVVTNMEVFDSCHGDKDMVTICIRVKKDNDYIMSIMSMPIPLEKISDPSPIRITTSGISSLPPIVIEGYGNSRLNLDE